MKELWRGIKIIGGLSLKVSPGNTILATVLFFLSAAAPLVFAVALGDFADSLSAGTATKVATSAVIILGLCASGSMILDETARRAILASQEIVTHELSVEIFRKVTSVRGIEHHERPDYVDTLSHLRNDQWFLSRALPTALTSFFLIVQLGATIAIIAKISPYLLFLFLLGAPEAYANLTAERRRLKGMEELRQQWRRSDDMFDLITNADSAKEIRLFGLADEILDKHRQSSKRSYEREFGDRFAGAGYVSAARMLTILAFSASMLLVLHNVASNGAPIGTALTFAALISTISTQLSSASGQFVFLTYASVALKRFLWVSDHAQDDLSKKSVKNAPKKLQQGIRFENVSFQYPGTEKKILNNLNLFLPAGKTIALIGDNGAGKSTLVKLLTRMYEPTSGRIFIDDLPLDEINASSWRTVISGAFQDHARLEFLASETVGIGDIGKANDQGALRLAIDQGGATEVIDQLPKQLDQQLGKTWEEGVDLSGGQWQKLAVARSQMREPLLLLLDEPTSALDAESEHTLFERFADATSRLARSKSGAISLLISHRFSTVRMADQIVVLSDGIVLELGTHEELIDKKGLYHELYNMQARAYV